MSQVLAAFMDGEDGATRFDLVSMNAARLPDPLLDAVQFLLPYERRLVTSEVNLSIHSLMNLKTIRDFVGEWTLRLGGEVMLDTPAALRPGVQVVSLSSSAGMGKRHSAIIFPEFSLGGKPSKRRVPLVSSLLSSHPVLHVRVAGNGAMKWNWLPAVFTAGPRDV